MIILAEWEWCYWPFEYLFDNKHVTINRKIIMRPFCGYLVRFYET